MGAPSCLPDNFYANLLGSTVQTIADTAIQVYVVDVFEDFLNAEN